MRQPAAPVSAAAVPTGRWYRVATPLQDSIPHRQPVTLWLEGNLFVRRGLHGCDQGGAGIGTGCLLFGESIERFRKKLVYIVKTAALDSVQHATFKLGLVDFDVHSRPPFHHYGSMPQSPRESGLGAMGNAAEPCRRSSRRAHRPPSIAPDTLSSAPHGSPKAERTEGFRCARVPSP